MRGLLLLVTMTTFSASGYDGNSFPLDGLRFQGYYGTDSKPLYELGWFVLWLGWPMLAFIFLSAYQSCRNYGVPVGCFGTLLTVTVVGGLGLFWLINFDYFLGYTLGLMVFGAGCVKSQIRGGD